MVVMMHVPLLHHCTIASTMQCTNHLQVVKSPAQELGTLLNSLKEGVKTITAITKYGMMKTLLLPMLTNLYWW